MPGRNTRRNTKKNGHLICFAFHCHTDCSVGGCHCRGKVTHSACILCVCGCMGALSLLLVRAGTCVFRRARICQSVRGCICCLEGRVRLWLQQTYCNCIPSYMTAVFPYRRVCERQHIMFTCTHRESLTRQGSKQTAIIKACCWSLVVFNQWKPAKEAEHISLWLSVKGGITLPSFRVPFNFTTCSSTECWLHLHY